MGKTTSPIIQWVLLPAAATLVVVGNLLPVEWVPQRDSGVFLYVAQTILDGGLPYRDVWDHKPPGVYYIDALGLLLAGHSLWGVWLLEFLAIAAAAMAGFVAMARVLGVLPALAGSAGWLLGLQFILGGGNLPEEFGLPLQFVALAIAVSKIGVTLDLRRWVAVGLMFGSSILLKPTLGGIHLTLVAYLVLSRVLHDPRGTVRALAAFALGTAAPVLAAVGYFWANGALTDTLDQVVAFNRAYTDLAGLDGLGLERRLGVVLTGLWGIPTAGLAALAICGWVVAAASLLRGVRAGSPANALLWVVVVGFPLEMALSSVTGRPFRHYFIAWLPVMGCLTAVLVHRLLAPAPASVRAPDRAAIARGFAALSVAALLGIIALPAAARGQLAPRNGVSDTTAARAAEYLSAHTAPTDPVLVWGAESTVNSLAWRKSPTRFVYQGALYTPGYQSDRLTEELLADLRMLPPRVVVDTSPTNDQIPPIAPMDRAAWKQRTASRSDWWFRTPPALEKVVDLIARDYRPATRIAPGNWPVYVLDR